MSQAHNPRRGSMQFWPRKRSRHSLVRVRSWADENKVKPLGFIGYKAGMVQLRIVDNHPKSLTKGQTIASPSTIIECPPMTVFGVVFYKNSKTLTTILAEKLAKELKKKMPLPKKKVNNFSQVGEYDDLRLLVHSNPRSTGIGTKKPKIIELVLGGDKEGKLNYAQQLLGNEIKIEDVFDAGNSVDVHGVSKGKGYQGTVKRYGVPIRQHKAEKTKRGIGTLGSWTPKRVQFTVPQPGKMGYHLRTEYNKQILRVGQDGKEVNSAGGVVNYGLVKNHFVLLKGSVVGPKKRAVFLSKSIRPNIKQVKEAPELVSILK
ncbi:MAG TPA: 50S ribosomal protein L3 [Candidatus Nanoarchaeia archaeon]|nr:50S ribosomal protein L3 [Candidatus Nanoarchaeia archaeon]